MCVSRKWSSCFGSSQSASRFNLRLRMQQFHCLKWNTLLFSMEPYFRRESWRWWLLHAHWHCWRRVTNLKIVWKSRSRWSKTILSETTASILFISMNIFLVVHFVVAFVDVYATKKMDVFVNLIILIESVFSLVTGTYIALRLVSLSKPPDCFACPVTNKKFTLSQRCIQTNSFASTSNHKTYRKTS